VLGVIAAGSGNGLARALGIPRGARASLHALAHSVVRPMDVGLANGKIFLNIAGAGFDAAVGRAFDEHGRRGGRRGMLSYFRMGLATAWGYKTAELRLEAGETQWRHRAFVVAFANGRQYGGGAEVAPKAVLDDGLLDVVAVEDAPAAEILVNLPLMYLGRIDTYRRYTRVLATGGVLTADAPFAYHRDGEPEPPTQRLEVTIRPRALHVLVPPARLQDRTGPFQEKLSAV
jgi:diacylglycerol kinase (ATP)